VVQLHVCLVEFGEGHTEEIHLNTGLILEYIHSLVKLVEEIVVGGREVVVLTTLEAV
jgi:hypothetical protein